MQLNRLLLGWSGNRFQLNTNGINTASITQGGTQLQRERTIGPNGACIIGNSESCAYTLLTGLTATTEDETMLTTKEALELRRLDELWRTKKATKKQILRHMQLSRKDQRHAIDSQLLRTLRGSF